MHLTELCTEPVLVLISFSGYGLFIRNSQGVTQSVKLTISTDGNISSGYKKGKLNRRLSKLHICMTEDTYLDFAWLVIFLKDISYSLIKTILKCICHTKATAVLGGTRESTASTRMLYRSPSSRSSLARATMSPWAPMENLSQWDFREYPTCTAMLPVRAFTEPTAVPGGLFSSMLNS